MKKLLLVLFFLALASLACNLPAGLGQPPAEAPASQPVTPPETEPEAPANQPVQPENPPAGQPTATQAPPPTPTPVPIDPEPLGMRQGLASLNTFQLVLVNKTSGPTPLDQSETRMEMTGDNPNEALVVYNRSSSISQDNLEPDVSENYQYTVGLESCDGFGEEWNYESSTPAEKELRDAMSAVFDMLVLGPGAEYVGTENVNGVDSHHFSFQLAGLGASSGAAVTANQGDYWLAVDGRYLVRYQLLLEFSDSPEETYRMEMNMDLSQINQPVTIALPAGCLAARSTP